MIKLVQKYKVFVRGNIPGDTGAENSIDRSKDELFLNFLVYCFPISFIALIPGVYMALSDGLPAIAAIDLAAATLLVVATFANRMTLNTRKFLVIVLFYPRLIFDQHPGLRRPRHILSICYYYTYSAYIPHFVCLLVCLCKHGHTIGLCCRHPVSLV
jgi:hypothetical protein